MTDYVGEEAMITDGMDRCPHCGVMYEVGAGHKCATCEHGVPVGHSCTYGCSTAVPCPTCDGVGQFDQNLPCPDCHDRPGHSRLHLTPLSVAASAARTPRPPGELVDAVHDRVHRDLGRSRPARSTKVRERITAPRLVDDEAGTASSQAVWDAFNDACSVLDDLEKKL